MITVGKTKLVVGFADFWGGMDTFFISILSERYEVIRNDAQPDYLFFSDEMFGTSNRLFDGKKNVKIFYTGENVRPDSNRFKFHRAISFDYIDEDWHFRLPLYVIDYWMMVHMHGMKTIAEMQQRRTGDGKEKFCCFISGNPVSQKRNDLFAVLNAYKKVDAAGPLFNNIGHILPRGLDAAKTKDDFMQGYKFNLCPENSSYPGYVTEKLFHAFYSGTVPIYWGDPSANAIFNSRAMVNWHDYLSDEALVQRVMELDADPAKYADVISQPIFNNGNTDKHMDPARFLDWFRDHVHGVFAARLG